jgi:SNF2 family DNA or RNA helicase
MEWTRLLKRSLTDQSQDIKILSHLSISVPWYSFLSSRTQIAQILGHFKISLSADAESTRLLEQANISDISYQGALEIPCISSEQLRAKLDAVGFTRQLTPEQERNVSRLASWSAGATFSVPGAGKTTEALAYFFFRTAPEDRLLVIAPKNALGAWDEQLAECIGPGQGFVRLKGGVERVDELLRKDSRFSIITYQQLNTTREVVASHVASRRMFVFLDESHRIKGGRQLRTGEAVLELSHLPVGKLILSGTPMPQADSDLVPQFTFLYPQIEARPENVVALMRRIYVRTTKSELGLPPISFYKVHVQMRNSQSKVYDLLKLEVARQAEDILGNRGKAQFRQLGRSVMRLLAFVSNPPLLAQELDGIEGGYLDAILSESAAGPKVDYACRRARELARAGRKVIIWTSFVKNVEVIAERLSDIGAVYIHGGVDSGDEDDSETREGKIRLFHDSRKVMAMVANPAAAGEGISLHKVCHNAIYVDRTYNAAHFLQSQDRIHRLGLEPGQSTLIEILECSGTIDESVGNRLLQKIRRMAVALDDPSLIIDPIPVDPTIMDEDEDGFLGLENDDIRDMIVNLRGSS